MKTRSIQFFYRDDAKWSLPWNQYCAAGVFKGIIQLIILGISWQKGKTKVASKKKNVEVMGEKEDSEDVGEYDSIIVISVVCSYGGIYNPVRIFLLLVYQ